MNFLRWCPPSFTQPISKYHLKIRIFSRSTKNNNNEFLSIPSFQACCSSQSMRNTESSVSFEEAWDLILKSLFLKVKMQPQAPPFQSTVPLHYLAFCGLEHVKAGFLHVHVKCGINVEIRAKTWISDGHLAGWNCKYISSEAVFVDTLSYVYWWGCSFFCVLIITATGIVLSRDKFLAVGTGNWNSGPVSYSMSLVYLLLIIDDKLGESFHCCLGNGPERPSPLQPCPVHVMHLSLIPRKQSSFEMPTS